MGSSTILPDTKDSLPNIPWYRKLNEDKKTFMQYYKGKDDKQAIQDLSLPAIYHVGEIIHSPDKPPQVRLQACQMILNKVIGDKIEITQSKQVVDINKLLDQLSTIRQVSVIDVTPISNDNKDIA